MISQALSLFLVVRQWLVVTEIDKKWYVFSSTEKKIELPNEPISKAFLTWYLLNKTLDDTIEKRNDPIKIIMT